MYPVQIHKVAAIRYPHSLVNEFVILFYLLHSATSGECY